MWGISALAASARWVILALLVLLLGGCEQTPRFDYSDARQAKLRYRECLNNNPGDPGACEHLRADAGEQYEDFQHRRQQRRGCDADPTLCPP